VYKIYYLVSNKTKSYYIGMTKCSLNYRLNSHKFAAKSGVKSKIYTCMRKYGVDNFIIVLVNEFNTHKECCEAEIKYISEARKNKHNILNIANGGEGGFCVKDRKAWRLKLSEKRKGKKPSLGMKHSDKNRDYFSKVSRAYWEENRMYRPEDINGLSFKEANQKYGISRTHFYRLKRASCNE